MFRSMTAGLTALAGVALTACGVVVAPAETLQTAPNTVVPQVSVTTETLPPVDVPLLATFLAAVDDATVGTENEGVAFEDPESVIGTAALFCQLLTQGLTVDEVLTAYVAALAKPGEPPPEDADLRLGGIILGAGVETICPEFQDRLEP